MQNYTIMPLDTANLEAVCQDIKYQYENGIATCALFSMTLTPEGNPAINKAEIMCEKYDKFRDRLAEMGLECGILVQASIGHGYKLNEKFGFQPLVAITTGEERYTCCPFDEDFRAHFKNQMSILASHKPKVIMLDDDFRLMARATKGCACPMHLKRVSELIGEEITREQLWECTQKKDARSKEITKAFIQSQGESLLGAVKEMRAGIDAVDPSLPGVFCCCGNGAEFAAEIAEIFAGKGNPVTVRINNGNYTPAGGREQSVVAFRAAIQKIHLGDKVDAILAETDTCPQNRYSTSAMSLHTHFTVTIMEGAAGAKHWITRLMEHEPESGKVYRKVLSKYCGFYNTLSDLVQKINWVGANNFMSPNPSYGYENEYQKTCHWAHCVLERMGIPMYYSSKVSNAVFLDGEDAENFTDDEIRAILSGTAVFSNRAAQIFIKRGYGEYLGVDIKEWNGPNTSSERIADTNKKVKVQQQVMEIVPLSDNVKEDSTVYHLKGGKELIRLFPGSTIYKNALGGTAIVFSGVPEAAFHYTSAFSFLSETRKAQLVKMLKDAGSLPIYMVGDDEVYLKAGTLDGDLYAMATNTSFDPMDEITFCIEKKVSAVEYLTPDGKFETCPFETDGDMVTVKIPVLPLQPVVIKFTA